MKLFRHHAHYIDICIKLEHNFLMSNMPSNLVFEATRTSVETAEPVIVQPRAGYSVSRPSTQFVAKFDLRMAGKLGLKGTPSADCKSTLVEAVGLSGNPGHPARNARLIVADDVNGMSYVQLPIRASQAFAAKSMAQPEPTGIAGINLPPVVDLTAKARAQSSAQLASARLAVKLSSYVFAQPKFRKKNDVRPR
jgi:hypothetical protein